MADWYTRVVFFSADVAAALAFYEDCLGFTAAWRYEEGGKLTVAQANFSGCEIILSLDPSRAGRSRLFISLEQNEMSTLESLIAERELPAKEGWWGYPVLEIRDPDGNELFFPREADGTQHEV